ncbi:MAG: DUF1266 domain-containing protein [Tannerella sp.]|jgi:hypothetical protein|nr:DUF1266 domain-containing protein [Tannerella sp.]
MKKTIYSIILGIAICFIMPLAITAQNTQVQEAKNKAKQVQKEMAAAQAQRDSIKLATKQQQALYDAQNKRTQQMIWLFVVVGLGTFAVFFFLKNKSTVMSIIRIFTGGYRIKGDIMTLESKKILTGAIYADQQGAYLNTLTADIGNKLYTILSDWWGINDRDSAIETLDYLRDKGYAYYFPTVYKAFSASSDQERKDIITSEMTTQEDAEKAYAQTHNLLESVDSLKKLKLIEETDDIEKYGVVGWDAGRLIFIARLCYDAKYIDEEEAWIYIDAAYAQAQKAFKSWDELAKSYVIGRFIWNGKSADDGIQHFADDLVNKPNSPWKQVAWRS